MKKFFGKIKGWFQRHKPSKRRLIQLYAALLYNANIKGFITGDIYKGGTKYMCVPGLNCYSCPGAAGACPLGALQNALTASGTRAPYYVIGIILLFGLILGRTICGFLCPVGFAQELLYKIKTPKLKKSKFTRIFSYFKYIVLVALVIAVPLMFGAFGFTVPGFCKYICPAGTFGGAIGLLINPTNDNLFALLGSLFTWKFAVFVVVFVASIFIFRFFCRFFCPLGALYGFFSKIALIGVKLDKNKCTDCGLCLSACKMDIKHVGDHECIHCGYCIPVCPANAIRWKGSKLFVHENAVDDLPPPSEEKPLGALLNAAEGAESVAIRVETPAADSVTETVVQAEASDLPAVEAAAETPRETSAQARRRKEKKRNFWLQFSAWAVALVVLVGALVYYNFIDKSRLVGANVGNVCPDFTVSLYGEADGEYRLTEETFTLSESQGRVRVINFWTYYCGPCVEELPEFERFQKEYAESVTVVAIHGDPIDKSVASYIKDTYHWSDFTLRFAQDTVESHVSKTYEMLGGRGSWPLTVILDAEGVITYSSSAALSYDRLKTLVDPLLAE
jgi:ferredoxin/thiol-disulfide isomerase/thioredoxin